ncbi:MAG: DUF4276 family protein [Isosphaerales bacterium]
MARLYLFGEGPTEQTFADTVLKPHLANSGVYLHRPILIAHAKKKGRVHRGGGRNYIPMKNDILRLLAQDKAKDVFFTTMIDLYGIPSQFPGLDEVEKLRHLPDKRVEFLEQAFSMDIRDARFIPYIQLHEYEAYLFSKPSLFELFYDHHRREIATLQAIADAHTSPEWIDDGQQSAPSKRIIAHLPDYAKPVMGPQLAELIGLDVIRAKCPHFNAWLSRLEKL